MTLAQRLLVAIGIVTVVTTVALGLGVREAWRSTEEAHFQEKFALVQERLKSELLLQIRDLPPLINALCQHDPVLDSAFVELGRDHVLNPDLRTTLPLRVRDLMKAMRLDELTLVTGRGEILGAGHADGLIGKVDAKLGARLKQAAPQAKLREQGVPAVEAQCSRSEYGITLGFIAARRLGALFQQVGASYGVELSLDRAPESRDHMLAVMRLPTLGDTLVVVTQPRVPLQRALARLDATIVVLGGATFSMALVFALLLSRGLARPIVNLSRQAREVMRGDPKPVEGRGGRELEEFADAFNQAIFDLSAMRKRLAATERIAARREIARRVAHEIKNPLAPIRAAVETLRRLRARNDPAFDEYFDEATRTVLDEVRRISSIVGEFTRFARLPPPNPGPMDLGETVRQVTSLYAAGKIPIEFSCEPCKTLNADRDQIVQVTTNLLQNALEALNDCPNPHVVVLVSPLDGAHVRLVVRDNGPGVPRAMRERLFEPYATSKAEGTGLGLAIVERIVLEHGGEIHYEDAAGGGAEFSVTLPISGPTLLPEAPASSPISRPEPAPSR